MTGQFFDTMIVASADKKWLLQCITHQNSLKKCGKLSPAILRLHHDGGVREIDDK